MCKLIWEMQARRSYIHAHTYTHPYLENCITAYGAILTTCVKITILYSLVKVRKQGRLTFQAFRYSKLVTKMENLLPQTVVYKSVNLLKCLQE